MASNDDDRRAAPKVPRTPRAVAGAKATPPAKDSAKSQPARPAAPKPPVTKKRTTDKPVAVGPSAGKKPAAPKASTPKKAATTARKTPAPVKAETPAATAKSRQPKANIFEPVPEPIAAASPAAEARNVSSVASTVAPPLSPESGAHTVMSEMAENIERIEALTSRMVAALSQRQPHDPSVDAPGPELYMNAGMAWMKMMAEQPARIIEQQVKYWGETLAHYARVQGQLSRGRLTAPEDEDSKDRRFANPLWKTHPFFNFVKRQYQINARAMREAASELEMPTDADRVRVNWLTNQIIDMFAPTNFLATNPDAIEKALETEGESLVKGLENLVRDIEQHGGELVVSLADRDAFEVGRNIGTAEGQVVMRTDLYELIQFSPTTDKVHALPVVIFPPWINKFYILDLKPQNSLIRWVVEQGYTLFVVSWKNPDRSYADYGMENYINAYMEIVDAILDITGEQRLNAVGYCIAGTTLSLTLALMAQKGDDRIASATLFTTLTDFSDQGEFTPFLQDDFVDGIESEVTRAGIFDGRLMSRTMSFLRANDLVWGPAIRSYLMGEAPPAFDLLYWNGDSTNLPGRMTVEYLRGLCQKNQFAGDGFPVMGHRLKLSDITLPICAVACETDHIAPWKHSWRGVAQMGSTDKKFIVSESGHIAGIVNPPSKGKYGHYLGGNDFDHGADTWRESAVFHPGTWWPVWQTWLAERSGDMVPARIPAAGLAPAPGTYVHEKNI